MDGQSGEDLLPEGRCREEKYSDGYGTVALRLGAKEFPSLTGGAERRCGSGSRAVERRGSEPLSYLPIVSSPKMEPKSPASDVSEMIVEPDRWPPKAFLIDDLNSISTSTSSFRSQPPDLFSSRSLKFSMDALAINSDSETSVLVSSPVETLSQVPGRDP
jgi:hypothetical protein